jgi:hypothetical protein
MRALYHDSMVIASQFGTPDLFITVTCNTQWPEIQAALMPWETAWDRPDLIARAFNNRLKSILNDIIKGNVCGEVEAIVHVIEFQKRGYFITNIRLPHCHILVTLKPGSKLRSSHSIDSLISAELPNQSLNPDLFNKVTSHMLHGPCGLLNPKASCMVLDPYTGQFHCKRGFPKDYTNNTTSGNNSFSTYRRRDDGSLFSKNMYVFENGKKVLRSVTFTNSDIASYSPYFTSKYDCHIFFEHVASIKAQKYIYKYLMKGNDASCVNIEGIY